MHPRSTDDDIDKAIREIGWNVAITRFGVCVNLVVCGMTLVHAYVQTEFYGASLPWLILRIFDAWALHLLARLFWFGYARSLALLDLLRQERFNRSRRRARSTEG
jgi:hypothetical protein